MAFPLAKSRSLSLPSSLHPLTSKSFSAFWVGAFLSSIGFWIQTVGQGWQVLQLTSSPFLLGLVAFASTVPNIVFSLFGGVIADRMNRRYLLLAAQIFFTLSALCLGILTTLHMITVWHIILIAILNGLVNTVGIPAWQAFISDLVPANDLRQGIALNSMQFNLSRVIGPAVGGISIGVFGIAGSYYLNALSYVGVIIVLFFIRPAIHQQEKPEAQQSIIQGLREGLHYVSSRPSLQIVLLLLFFIAFLVFPYLVLLPVFADDVFHIGAPGLGLLNAAAGIGALGGSILVVVLTQRLQNGPRALSVLCLVGGVACFAFAAANTLSTALPLLIVLGVCNVMSMTLTNTTIQTMVPDEMRARVLSIWVMISLGLAPFGNLAAGWVAQIIGAPLTLGVGGALCTLATLMVIAIRTRSILHFAH